MCVLIARRLNESTAARSSLENELKELKLQLEEAQQALEAVQHFRAQSRELTSCVGTGEGSLHRAERS